MWNFEEWGVLWQKLPLRDRWLNSTSLLTSNLKKWSMKTICWYETIWTQQVRALQKRRRAHTLTDFLSIFSMIVFSYMVELSIFFDCDIKMHENTTQLCLNQLRILKTLFFRIKNCLQVVLESKNLGKHSKNVEIATT